MFNVKFGVTRAVTVALGKRDSVNSFIEPLSGTVGAPDHRNSAPPSSRPVAKMRRAAVPGNCRIAKDVCGAHTPLVPWISVRRNTIGPLPYCWSFIWLIALGRICLDNRQVAHFES